MVNLRQQPLFLKTVVRQIQRLRFHAVGPTVIHLEHELYLLCCMILFLIGSMHELYNESFGTCYGDYQFIFVVSVVLSRHLFFRIWCTWDPSTHASPTISGLISHILQTFVNGGQIFDRPAPPIQLSYIHNLVTTNSNDRNFGGSSSATSTSTSSGLSLPSSSDRMHHIMGGYLETRDVIHWSQLLPSVLTYVIQIPRKMIWFRFSRMVGIIENKQSTSKRNENHAVGVINKSRHPDSSKFNRINQNYGAFWLYFIRIVLVYGPSLPYLISTKVSFDILWHAIVMQWLNFRELNKREISNLAINTHDVNLVRQTADLESGSMLGFYDRQLKPTMATVLYTTLVFGVFCSLFIFSRVVFPLPDMVSCGNVAKDVRVNSGSASGSSTKKGSRPVHNAWISSLRTRLYSTFRRLIDPPSCNASDAAPWVERQYSVATTNRLHVCLLTIIGRVLENIVIVGILPRTRFACRATGHCPEGPLVWELSRILYPGGLNTPKRLDNMQSYDYLSIRTLPILWTISGIFFTSTVLLLAQTLTLNRTYLSIMAYHSLEWELISKDARKGPIKSSKTDASALVMAHQQPPVVWEVKHKYLKGDLVYYPDVTGSLYRARVHSPEGHPNHSGLRLLDEVFLSELGHPATSRIHFHLAAFQLVNAGVHFGLWVIISLFGLQITSYTFVWGIISHFLAVHGVLLITHCAANVRIAKNNQLQTSGRMSSLQELNAEILNRNC